MVRTRATGRRRSAGLQPADIRNPGLAQCCLFLDAREDGFEDSHFVVHPGGFREGDPALYRLVDFPDNYHNDAGDLTFADGHGAARRWRDPRTQPPLVRDHDQDGTAEGVPCAGNPDVKWIQDRTFQRSD